MAAPEVGYGLLIVALACEVSASVQEWVERADQAVEVVYVIPPAPSVVFVGFDADENEGDRVVPVPFPNPHADAFCP
jgi:hypothetical protein